MYKMAEMPIDTDAITPEIGIACGYEMHQYPSANAPVPMLTSNKRVISDRFEPVRFVMSIH